MAVENLGFVAMDGVQIFIVMLSMLIVLFIPGYILSLALFPKKKELELGERVALSIILGITPAFFLMLLNLTFEVKFSFVTDLIALILISAIGIVVYIKRGGDLRSVQGI